MSNKVKGKIQQKTTDKKVTISKTDFQYLNSIEVIKRSIDHYLSQLQGEYIKILSIDLGYKPEQDLQFGIDLQSDTRELTIHEVTAKEKTDLRSTPEK